MSGFILISRANWVDLTFQKYSINYTILDFLIYYTYFMLLYYARIQRMKQIYPHITNMLFTCQVCTFYINQPDRVDLKFTNVQPIILYQIFYILHIVCIILVPGFSISNNFIQVKHAIYVSGVCILVKISLIGLT